MHVHLVNQPRSSRLLEQLAAPRWSLLFFLFAAVSALVIAQAQQSATLWMALPFSLLLLNLLAAIIRLPRFRRDLPLLVFHLALLLMVVLFACTRLTYLRASATLTKGSPFDGTLLSDERGPLHGDGLNSLEFTNLGFNQNYSKLKPGNSQYSVTYNRVSWRDQSGQLRVQEIGDDHPLAVGHYRIYTTRRRGFTPIFLWQPHNGPAESGSVQLNALSEGDIGPTNEWQLPDGTPVWTMLDISNHQQILNDNVNLSASTLNHSLIIRTETERHSLQLGQSVPLQTGTLTYLRLDSWMGYRIVYDPVQPWLMATVLAGISCLVWFYLRKLFGKGSWDSDR
ncbi:MAG: hypothetical protein V7629_17410 [Motiliproteus sp.]